jgi:prevent-host-death family protein
MLDDGHVDGYIEHMTHYSVAEAKNNLPRLLDRMLQGEEVVITRRGKAIARLRPADHDVRQPPVDADWLRRVRVKPTVPTDGPTLVRQMRDEQA